MSAPIRFKPSAARDVASAFGWYEEQRAGLGAEFLDALNSTLNLIASNPESGPVVRSPIRRAVLRRFPYLVFYVVDPDELVVLACMHASRDPQHWPE